MIITVPNKHFIYIYKVGLPKVYDLFDRPTRSKFVNSPRKFVTHTRLVESCVDASSDLSRKHLRAADGEYVMAGGSMNG